MDPYPFVDETELPGFAEAPGLGCGGGDELGLAARDAAAYAGLDAAGLDAELDGLSLYTAARDGDGDALELPGEAAAPPGLCDLGLLPLVASKEADPGGGCGSGAARKGRPPAGSPHGPFLDCGLCGKVFGSASALSKHYLSHSQERKHVCGVCGKAFKRQDHLSGHMLTHQKTKPFACLEKGCAKSYCDHRSLRRHCELQHGLCVPKAPRDDDGAAAAAASAAARGTFAPGPSPPERELLRCVVSGFVSQKLPARPDAAAPWPPCSSPAPFGAASGAVGDSVSRDPLPCPRSAAASSVFAVAIPGAAPESGSIGWTDRSLLAEPPLAPEPAGFPVFRGLKGCAGAPPPSGWVRNVPVCAKSKRSGGCAVDGFAGAPAALAQPPERADALPFAASQLLLAPSERLVPHPLPAAFRLAPPEPSGYEGSSLLLPGSLAPPQKDVLLDNESRGQQAVPAFQSLQPGQERGATEDASIPGGAMGCHSYRNAPDNQTPGASRKERSKSCSGEAGGRVPAAAGRSRRPPGIRKERLELAAASPSQVAMASFPAAPARPARPRLTIFNRIQGGNIYSFPSAVKEESLPAGCNKPSGVPTDGGRYESGFLCKNCSQLFYTEKGLESHMCFRGEQWYSPERKEEQQENGNAPKPLQHLEVGSSPCEAEVRVEAAAPLVIPVSVPVTTPNPQASGEEGPGCLPKVSEQESRDANELQENARQRKRKRQMRPKSLFIPAPPACEAQPPAGGRFQSNLRSPVFLVDHLLRDLLQSSPYTPPPMLSPIREGSGLYFSTLCSSAGGDPNQLFGTVLDGMDRDFGFCLVKDNTKISIEPHINIGSRFQAEIPPLQDRSDLENDDQAASLVWKPWGDIATNRETQDRVSELLNMACSSVMPGGGTNLELALHCLHEARGNVLEALEMLLFGGRQKSESHPLASYRYAGSDIWTPLERQLFKKAFCVHRKDFYLIQKKIQTKNVAQCVEYYYIWKKIIKFDCSRVQGIEKKVKRDKNELEKTEEKPARSPPGLPGPMPEEGARMKQRSPKEEPAGPWSPSRSPGASPCRPASAFPCRECGRVFDKIKSRNAHMKRHRLQEQAEPLGALTWPPKHSRGHAEAAGTPLPPE